MAPHITTGLPSAEAKALRLLNDSLTLHYCFFHVREEGEEGNF